MNLLITETELKTLKINDLVPLSCIFCHTDFQIPKAQVLRAKNPNHNATANFCSRRCSLLHIKPSKVKFNCKNCNVVSFKTPSQVAKVKNNFCSRSCASTYNNKNKTFGLHKSKAEIYLVELIKNKFPQLKILENSRQILPSGYELDLFIPNLMLAIELNGPVHYYPIYGQSKLDLTKNKDLVKLTECQNLGITLISLDISNFTYFKKTKVFLDAFFENDLCRLLNFQ